MKRSFTVVLALALLLGIVPAAAAQSPTGGEGDAPQVSVLTERFVREIVGEKYAYLAVVSPDGSAIAWGKQTGRGKNKVKLLCLYTFANADKVCYDVPSAFEGFPSHLVWSPDSTYIAFTENPLQLGMESDVWVFDVAQGSFADLTDDGAEGAWRTLEVDYTLDYMPMWDPTSGDVYFWRSVPTGDYDITMAIYRVAPDGGEAELVRDLSEYLQRQLIYFHYERYYMDGPSAMSPDGTQVAVAFTSFEDVYNTQENGVWLVDLTDSEAAPRQVMTMDELQLAIPEWQLMPGVPLGLSWTSDGVGVVVVVNSNDTHSPLNVFYYIDAETGESTPVVDFSSLEDIDSLFAPAGGGLPMRYYSPWTASLSPAGDKLLMYNALGGLSGIFAAPLPPDGSLPALVYVSETSDSSLDTRSSRANDGKVIMYGLMFTVSEE